VSGSRIDGWSERVCSVTDGINADQICRAIGVNANISGFVGRDLPAKEFGIWLNTNPN